MPLVGDDLIGKWRDTAFNMRGVCATYRQVSQSRNTETGLISESNTDTSVTVLRSGGGSSKSEDRTFRARMCELPDYAPRTGDRVVLDDVVYNIVSWQTDQSRYIVDMVCRRA